MFLINDLGQKLRVVLGTSKAPLLSPLHIWNQEKYKINCAIEWGGVNSYELDSPGSSDSKESALTMQWHETWFLDWEDTLGEDSSNHSSILAWRNSMRQRHRWAAVHGVKVECDWETFTSHTSLQTTYVVPKNPSFSAICGVIILKWQHQKPSPGTILFNFEKFYSHLLDMTSRYPHFLSCILN